MEKAVFNPNGGPIRVEIKAGHAPTGSYSLLLWGADTNAIVQQWQGNFINTDDDFYFLPTPNEKNDGRILDCVATITLLPPIKDYRLEVEVSQDGDVLATGIGQGKSKELTVTVEVFVTLESEGE